MSSTLLKLQIGPVQEFIAQARSTRDLWSGSYLLSWLLSAGLNRLLQECAEAGLPEAELKSCVVFPRLKSQPLLQKRQPDLFPPPGGACQNDELLTPNLTNLFLAEIPLEPEALADVARRIEEGIRNEWKTIANRCWVFGGDLLGAADRFRFDRQVASLLHIAWQVTRLSSKADPGEVLKSLPLTEEMQKTIARASGSILLFPATLALNAWELDSVRQVRNFSGWRDSNDRPGKHNERDSLTGREERIVGGREWWSANVKGKRVTVTPQQGSPREVEWSMLFRERQASEYFGAITFIKRLWHLAYLEQEHGLEAGHRSEPRGKQFPFPSTLHIASHDPAKNEDDLGEVLPEEVGDLEKYFAVLTLDGDEMGKWMSGEKFPRPAAPDDLRRFSDHLSTFGLKCARPIVEACDGRLIYSGGDDVVALLPADTALPCAKFLRQAFKGLGSFIAPLKELAVDLLARHAVKAQKRGMKLGQAKGEYFVSPFLQAAAADQLFASAPAAGELILSPSGAKERICLPGATADVSAGVAIAHFKAPLQDVVRAAQAAEQRAKKQLGRAAVAVTLMKRSGEITEWGCQWDSGGLEIHDAIMQAMEAGAVSSKFPHRVIELLDNYLTDTSPLAAGSLDTLGDFPAVDIALREFSHVLKRQGQDTESPAYGKLANLADYKGPDSKLLKTYLARIRDNADAALQRARKDAAAWARLSPEARRRLEQSPVESPLRAAIGLCQTVAFGYRNTKDDSAVALPRPSLVADPSAERQNI